MQANATNSTKAGGVTALNISCEVISIKTLKLPYQETRVSSSRVFISHHRAIIHSLVIIYLERGRVLVSTARIGKRGERNDGNFSAPSSGKILRAAGAERKKRGKI